MQIFKLLLTLLLLNFLSCSAQEKVNHLANESSPYLLQHKYNPVDWYPWGEEALAKAKKENKMMIISIGYAACHWCHVMEHESFEDSLVAQVMNENFVCIKIDREERPDIDDVYMTACHLASGKSCGWPLNAFALPDGRPFWAGTYFPKKSWLEIMEYFIKDYEKKPEQLEEYAEGLTNNIQTNGTLTSFLTSDKNFTRENLDVVADNFLSNIDFKKGGRKSPPKFPMPNNYEFLMSYHQLSGNQKALDATTVTLDNMAWGGIYDHMGGGFARYSTDGNWKVPHFEKMMYDNGQLVSLYADAYKLTKNPLYKQVVEETLEWVKNDMTSEEGGFYSSLDADSEGVEGKYYIWTKEEIQEILGDKMKARIFGDYYEVIPGGNWEHSNILYRKQTKEKVAKKHNITITELEKILEDGKSKIMEARSKRIPPGLDDKVLTAWNALMLKGYVDAYNALGNDNYLETAIKNANFITTKMQVDGARLNRNYKNNKSVINAFLDDYALTIQAFIALYQTTFDEQWLYKADELTKYTMEHFFDEKSKMFHYTSDLDPALIARKMELGDNVIPGSNSTMAEVLHLLGLYLYNKEYTELAAQMMHNMAETITLNPQPNFYSNWCKLYLDLVNPPYEVVVIGPDAAAKRKELLKHYTPHAIFLGGENEGTLELLKSKLQDGETMIYVCQNKVCKLPVIDVDKALGLIGK